MILKIHQSTQQEALLVRRVAAQTGIFEESRTIKKIRPFSIVSCHYCRICLLIHILMLLLLVLLPILTLCSFDKPDIYMTVTNNLTLNSNASFVINQLLILVNGQYLQQGTLSANLSLTPTFPNESIAFNLLVFNLTNPASTNQYTLAMDNMSNYINSEYCIDCATNDCIKNLTSWQIVNTYTCCRNCVNQSIVTPMLPNTYLDELQNMNLLMMLDPSLLNNSGPLNMTMVCSTMMNTTNAWFYWEVILSCLLIFNVVVLTGVTIHMCLKYKKSTQKLLKHQLTDTSNRPKIQ